MDECRKGYTFKNGVCTKRSYNPLEVIRNNKGRFVKIIHSDFQFKKGHKLNLGNKLSMDTITKIKETLKGKHNSPTTEFKKGQFQGKTYEEIYGKEKAIKTKGKISQSEKGKIVSEESKEKMKVARLGKSWEEIMGKEKAEELRIKHSKFMSENQFGENNPSWAGGKSYEPYDKKFCNKFKHLIRKRDNYICMKCNKHQEKEQRSLEVHHINYDKLCSLPQNCVTLCHKCNVEANRNRECWTKFFQSLLAERYGYKYSESREIILEVF